MSIWTINSKKRNIKQLDSNKNIDILIIGAGITGLTTAYFLKYNKSMCVVDSGLIGYGVTKNSTAKINYLQESLYSKIAKSTNLDNAIKYLDSQKYAINELVSIISKEKIDCDLVSVPSYLFANTKSELEVLEDEVKFLRKNNVNIIEDDLPIKTTNYKSYKVDDTYVFNPIKYLNSLYNILTKENINIYENSRILKIKRKDNKYICYSDTYKITANKVVLACHYPYFLFPNFMPIKCSIEKSYMIVSKVSSDKKFTCINTNKPIYSCRYYEDENNYYQISLAKSDDLSKNKNDLYNFNSVKKIFNLNDKDIVMKYTNSDIITPDYMPYIGKLKNNMYIGLGYNTWGMTNGVLAAKIISNLILNRENMYELFDPNRINLQTIIKIPYYIFNNAKSFIDSKINKNRKWYSKNVKFYTKNGIPLACFIDQNNKKHIVINKCPHLKCSLIFNEVERTWDCPCHSSRFDIDGKRIKGPSNYDITYKE